MTRKQQRKLAEAIATELFTTGYGEEASRLAMLDKNADRLEGWCKEAVVSQIMDLLKERYL
ncbi:MAG: hypothetical protein Q8P35_00595 [Candidatus Yanofskybacteria bacterium]|nr:hypothetical protein [Candidatus Yanofskybacteria bacterium]